MKRCGGAHTRTQRIEKSVPTSEPAPPRSRGAREAQRVPLCEDTHRRLLRDLSRRRHRCCCRPQAATHQEEGNAPHLRDAPDAAHARVDNVEAQRGDAVFAPLVFARSPNCLAIALHKPYEPHTHIIIIIINTTTLSSPQSSVLSSNTHFFVVLLNLNKEQSSARMLHAQQHKPTCASSQRLGIKTPMGVVRRAVAKVREERSSGHQLQKTQSHVLPRGAHPDRGSALCADHA